MRVLLALMLFCGGTLRLTSCPPPPHRSANGIRLLPLAPEHVYALENLPPLHGDPFDRALMAQAQVEGLTLMSNDGVLKDYGVSLIW